MRLRPTLLAGTCIIASTLISICASTASAAQDTTTPVTAAPVATAPDSTTNTTAPAAATETPANVAPVENLPARGLTMDKVEAKFGAPTEKIAAVGKPPITRWEYPGYVVYFEREYVLHTVAK